MVITPIPHSNRARRIPFITVTALWLAVCSAGCQQLTALEEQQMALQQTLDDNAEQTAALVKQSETFQRSITEAVLALCDEQLALKNSLAEDQADREQAAEELQNEQRIRDDLLGQVIEELSTRLDDTVAQLQGLAESLGGLSPTPEQKNELAMGLVLLNDTQKTFQEALDALEQAHRQSQERLNRLEQEMAALKRGPANAAAVKPVPSMPSSQREP
jgi:chromosome segregation ATPase